MQKPGYISQADRKKILLICDNLLSFSGCGRIAKETVIHTAHHFNWVQMAGSIKTPDQGKIFDISADINKETGIKDSSVKLYPVNDYGTPQILREIIELEKPDALLLYTDPRYFTWVFNMEDEIRKKIPIAYLSIWDDLPVPHFNLPYYSSCDLLFGLSQQTHNIHKMVLDGGNIPYIDIDTIEKKVINPSKSRSCPILLKFNPHGLDENKFFPIPENDIEYTLYKNEIFKGETPDFVLFFNSRNIRRKQIPDSMLAFKHFLDQLPYEQALKCKFILKTEIVSEHGTDLEAVREYLFEEKYSNNIIFIQKGISDKELNYLYNIADAQILLTSNEGWGMTITEAVLAGTPIIVNVQGGLQTQMRFEDENGNWYQPSKDIPSNHRGTYKKHGEWAFPVYPSNISIQGSPLTPYIFDSRCKWEDAAEQIHILYSMTREERKERGLKGREWAISDEAGFTSRHQGERVIEAFDELFRTWKNREKYSIINANEYKGKMINHPIIY